MFGSVPAERRVGRALRLLVWLQISLLIFSLVAPIGAFAADPTDPPPSEEPSSPPASEPSPAPEPSAEPSAEPAASPDPTAEPTPDPTLAPTPAPTSPFIVTFAAGVSAADQVAAVADAGASTTDTIAALRMHAVNASSSAASALAADSRVIRVEPDRNRATEADPSDPSYSSQWALPKIGWDQVSGNVVSGSATVAILDTGVDGAQPDLAGQLVGGSSFVGGSATSDPNGHGTAMAGIVAATTDNGVGVAGVGFDGVSIMPVSVLGTDGTGRDSDVIEGLVWAADHGADVGLMAFSAPSYSSALQAAVDYAWSRGMVLVAATGNDGSSSASFPAGDRSVIGVSNTDSTDALNASSNHGASVFLAAPGTGIVTLAIGDGTTTVTGTSASAAHVAAAAALLRASDGSLSNGVIVGRLARTADAAGTAVETGNGRLNLARALADMSTESVQPAGAAPNGDGGPFVGPYVADNITGISVLLNGFTSINVGSGATLSLAIDVNNINGAGATTAWNSTGWVIASTAPPANTRLANCVNTTNHPIGGPYNETLTVTAPTTPGQYTLYVELDADDGGGPASCGAGTNHQRDSATTVAVLNVSATLNGAPTATVTAGSSVTAAVTLAVGVPINNWQSTGWAIGTVEPGFRTKLANCVDTADASSGTVTRSFAITAPATPGTYSVYFALDENDGTGANACGDGANNGRLTLVNALVVTPANNAPVVTPPAGQSSAEGSSTSFSLGSFTDAGPAPWAVDVDWGDGTPHTTFTAANAGSLGSQSHTYPDGPATHTVTVAATDSNGSGLTGAATFQVTINNVAPVTTFVSGDLTVNESGTEEHTYVFSIFDPGDDVVTGTATNCGIGGVPVPLSQTFSNTSLSFKCTFPDGPADPILQAAASDGLVTGPFTDQAVHVNNVAPTTAYVSGDLSVNESDTDTHTYVFSIFDPGDDAITGIGWGCGVGGTPVSGSDSWTQTSLTFACKFLDGPATPSLQVNAADPTAGLFTFQPILVNNVVPVANGESASTGESTVLIRPAPGVLGNDTDVANDPLVVGRVNGSAGNVDTEFVLPSGAKLQLNADGSYTYDPNGAFEYLDTGQFGADSFTYQAFDGNDFSNVALVSITIVGANDGPVAANASASVGHRHGAGVDITLSATDPEGHPHTFVIDSFPAHGSLSVGGAICSLGSPSTCTQTAHFTPNSPSGDYVGSDSFTYHADDGAAAGNVATVQLTLTNATPTATVSLSPSSPTTNQTLTATASASDADGEPVTLTYVWKNGATIVQTTTTTNLTSTLNLAIVGNGDKGDAITVEVTPSDGHVSGAMVSDHVTVANSSPVITDLTASPSLVDEGNGAEIEVDATDADGDVLSYEFNCTSELDGVYEVGPTSSDTYICIYDDGPDGHLVAVRVSDTSAESATASVGVAVQNVAPTGTFSAVTPTVNEGSPATVEWTNVTDPSNADTAAGFRYTYACSGSISDLDGDYTHLGGSLPTFNCTYFDNGFRSVATSVIDKNNGSTTTGAGITVLNVPPTLSNVAITSTVSEGGVATLTGTISDPGTLDTFELAVDWGDGTSDTFPFVAGTTGFIETHTYVDDDPSGTAADTYTVDLELSDDDSGSDTASTSVEVQNVSPTVSAVSVSPFYVDEGSPVTLAGSFTDPGAADTFTLTVDWGEGAPVPYSLAAGSTSFSIPHTYADDNPTGTFHDIYNISWLLVDDDDGGAAGIEQVSVENFAPTTILTGADDVFEGTTHVYSFTTTDPGVEDTFTLVGADCGINGAVSDPVWIDAFDSSDGSGSFSCTFPDDNPTGTLTGNSTVHVEVADDDDGHSIYDINVLIRNVDPVADIGADRDADEGDLVSFHADVTDQGVGDTFVGTGWQAVCSWGQTEGGSTFDLAFTPTDNGTCSVTFTVNDDDGGTGTDTAIVTVHNVAPTAIIDSGPTSTAEGSPAIHFAYHWSDPGADTWTLDTTCGPTGTKSGEVFDIARKTGSFDCAWADDNPTATGIDTETVSVKVSDDDTGNNTKTRDVTVSNVAPSVTSFTATVPFAGPLAFVPATFKTLFNDPGTDQFKAEFTWGDGTSQTVNSFHSGDTVDHVYPAAACGLTASVKVIDDDTGHIVATAIVNVGSGSFMAPMTNQPVTNKLKNGQVLPVKVQFTDCAGVGVTGLTPAIRLNAGDLTATFDDSTVTIATSVSGADTDGWMRPTTPNGTYIYNMKVQIPLNTDYTVVVYPYANQATGVLNTGYTLRHVIQATK
jgi:subtilisin family serine protease